MESSSNCMTWQSWLRLMLPSTHNSSLSCRGRRQPHAAGFPLQLPPGAPVGTHRRKSIRGLRPHLATSKNDQRQLIRCKETQTSLEALSASSPLAPSGSPTGGLLCSSS